MKELLSIIPKPSRYAGIEEGAIYKDPKAVRLRMALAFPDMYEIGMSYFGQKILYGLINQHPEWLAERVFTPCPEAGAILKNNSALLSSLESDTPLKEFDVIGFTLTHELCYTNILFMLDLAGIPFYSHKRGPDFPLIVAGGGCTLAAEPIAPFFDVMLLGDGEEILPEFLELLSKAKDNNLSKEQILQKTAKIPGAYIPSFFKDSGSKLPPVPKFSDYSQIIRRVLPTLDDGFYPTQQPIPFGAIHNRLTLEIARGCTRGCRFCQAGIIYRPVRERSLENLEGLLEDCLEKTGYDNVSLLSLSTGDFSGLRTFFHSIADRCAKEQIALSLPSLRVGSIDDSIMEKMSGIKRTGATLAPEAGSQRLRDVINKGITEDDIILHTRKLFEYGWQQIKLYFMIGLPTETDEDLLAIIDLCRKVRDAAGPGIKRLQVTASISPFVPKPHTPFQWVEQAPLAEIQRRIGVLLTAIKAEKRIKLRWHVPEMSFLEGIFSRGDRRLAPVIESAYNEGAIFTAWVDHFKLEPWLKALDKHSLSTDEFTGSLDLDTQLPWEHLQSGVTKDFLIREYKRGLGGKTTADCRYASCRQCGICDTASGISSLNKISKQQNYKNVLNFSERDQEAHQVNFDEYGRVKVKNQDSGSKQRQAKNLPPALAGNLAQKTGHYRIGYSKSGPASCLSQLELLAIFERAARRGNLPLTFSQGFNPVPLFSFTRALPVGVSSHCEWFSLYLHKDLPLERVQEAFAVLPQGLQVHTVQKIPLNQKHTESIKELYHLEWRGSQERISLFMDALDKFICLNELIWTKKGKKNDKTLDIRKLVLEIKKLTPTACTLIFDWQSSYISPQALILAALGISVAKQEDFFSAHEISLTKLAQDEYIR